ncbi:MAG: Ig-like domain-containing protein, partial [Ginsengibacter sp.]
GDGIQTTSIGIIGSSIQSMAFADNKLYAAGVAQFPARMGVVVRYMLPAKKAPIVTITDPANNTSIYGPVDITFTAKASDENGTITKVEFYNGTVLMATKFLKYSWTWKSSPVGKHKVTARAYDNEGLVTTSAPVYVTVVAVKPSTVTITEPTNNSTYRSPADIRITAVASKEGGAISKVEFYKGTTLLASERYLPYSWNWQNAPVGTHTITVKAYYSAGPVITSQPVKITVTPASAPVSSRPSFENSKIKINGSISLKLVPNPVNNILNIYTSGLQGNTQATISIISSSGVTVKTIKSKGSDQTMQLNVSLLPSGVYTIKIANGDKVINKQFVKM